MRYSALVLLIALLLSFVNTSAQAQLTSPMIGWQAEFSDEFHDVSGTVSIVDEDTLQFDDFTYDGGGIVVYYYLGIEDSPSAFSMGLPIGEDLFGTAFDGSQDAFTVDLPMGQTLEGYNAISVWCVTAGVSFSSGTFAAVEVPTGDFDADGDIDGADFLFWQRGESTSPPSAADLDIWQTTYGTQPALSTLATVPEPSSCLLVLTAMLLVPRRRRRR